MNNARLFALSFTSALLTLCLGLAEAGAPPPTLVKPVQIFNGKDLEGLESPTPGLWKVENGLIIAGDGIAKIPHNDFICTTKSFSNFILRVKLKLTGDPKTGLINSGVQIRSARIPGHHEVSGYQCDYGDPTWWGAIYDEGRRNKLVAKSDMAALDPVIHRGDWNEYIIQAEGPRIQTWLNGVQGVDYTEPEPQIAQDGILGVQVHGGGNARVEIKEIAIQELPPTPGAPTWDKVGRPPAKAAAPMKEGNAAGSAPKSPAEELACLQAPEGYEVQLVAAEDIANGIGKFVPIAFDAKGRIWTTTALEYPVDGNENPAAADALYASKAKDKVLIYDRDPASPTGYASKARVFAEGLAIPLGVLPYGNGCYVQHGHDIAFLSDTDGDGKADKREVILTGFGVQDSHLFPHQFTRAPGGWLWMAQGAFNYGKVGRPGEPSEKAVQFDQTRMAKFRPDGSDFTITSNGPCNIWGLVLTREGEAFIQEANDFGYPVMPFHEFGNYPGCSDRQWKSYAPQFPGTAPDFKVGGTGLSGLALTDADGAFTEAWRDVMLLANPITNRINSIKMHRDGPRWKLEQLPDFIVSSDPWFRPVAISMGPDGALYIVDWYNRIISHNEVPRNHPDRDKTRGRIWRVAPKALAAKATDFTKLPEAGLLAKLGVSPSAESHAAWQAIGDRKLVSLAPQLKGIAADQTAAGARRIAAFWALAELNALDAATVRGFLTSDNRNLRREAAAAIGQWSTPDAFVGELASLISDADPEVRATAIRALGTRLGQGNADAFIPLLVKAGAEALAEPTGPSTRNGKLIKVREAYEREFERYLVRMILEAHPRETAAFLDSPAAAALPLENRLLATLALEPAASASRIALLLPQLSRAPSSEELLRLLQAGSPAEIKGAIQSSLAKPELAQPFLRMLIEMSSRLDARVMAPLLAQPAIKLLQGDSASALLGVQAASAFRIGELEPALTALVEPAGTGAVPVDQRTLIIAALRTLADLGSSESPLFERIFISAKDGEVREAALGALASSKAPGTAERVLALAPSFTTSERRLCVERLSATPAGARALAHALNAGTLPLEAIDSASLDRLQALLDPKDSDLLALQPKLEALFRPVLALDGSDEAWTQTALSITGACTIEGWVRFDGDDHKITNGDGFVGAPGKLDINFFDAKPRVYTFAPVRDAVVAKKPVTTGLWTHIAATRNAAGLWKIYVDGDLNGAAATPAPGPIENLRFGWSGAKGGLRGALSETRIWDRERNADEIRTAFDRSLTKDAPGLVFSSVADGWGNCKAARG